MSQKDYQMTKMIRINLLVVVILFVLKDYLSNKLIVATMANKKGNPESFAVFLFFCFFTSVYKSK